MKSDLEDGLKIRKIAISHQVWTAEDMLTETRKLRRKVAQKCFINEIEKLYN